MNIMQKLLALAMISSAALATPFALTVAEPAVQAATTSACNTMVTSTARFDAIPTASPPPSNYAGLKYSGFTVVNARNYASFNAKSPSNVIAAGPEGASISQGSNPGSYIVFGLSSFYFACASTAGSFGPYPSVCQLEVITTAPSSSIDIQRYGPFSYTLGTDPQQVQNMTKVNLGAGGGAFYFNLVSGVGTSQLFLDNLVVYQHRDCP